MEYAAFSPSVNVAPMRPSFAARSPPEPSSATVSESVPVFAFWSRKVSVIESYRAVTPAELALMRFTTSVIESVDAS